MPEPAPQVGELAPVQRLLREPEVAPAPPTHLNDNERRGRSAVDGHDVPVPHFGIVLEWQSWQDLAVRLAERAASFVIEPGIRFRGAVGEQATFFLYDPSGNALEFKSFHDIARQLFTT